MIMISVNGDGRNLSDINANWIHEQIRERLKQGVPVCVQIHIEQSGINLSLSCGECGGYGGGGSGRAPNHQEQRVFDLWDELGCKHSPVNSGNIVAFLNQIKNL